MRPPAAAQSPVRGSFADVRTRGGAYDGYVVERACKQRSCVGIKGLGTSRYLGMEPPAGAREEAAFEAAVARFRAEVMAAIGAPPSFRASEYGGLSCTERGLSISTVDAADIDPAILKVGNLLRASGLKEEVTICHGGYLVNAGTARD
jgi:hypothetical protein